MKKKNYIFLFVFLFFVAVAGYLGSGLTQSFFGASSVEGKEVVGLDKSSFEYFGYDVDFNVVQGVQTETYNGQIPCGQECVNCPCSGSARYCRYYWAAEYKTSYCTTVLPYVDPFYCAYNISIDGQVFSGNTWDDFKRDFVKDDISIRLTGYGFNGQELGWNTVLDSSYYDPETGAKSEKQKCTGFVASFSLRIPQDKLDLRLDNNSVIFENSWRDLDGLLCIARNSSGVLSGECFNVPNLPVGVTKAEFELPVESEFILPVLRSVSVEGTPIGDFTGSWSSYDVRKKLTLYDLPEKKCWIPGGCEKKDLNIDEVIITLLGNDEVVPMGDDLKNEIVYKGIFQRFLAWLKSFV